jgi:hypothetical protein
LIWYGKTPRRKEKGVKILQRVDSEEKEETGDFSFVDRRRREIKLEWESEKDRKKIEIYTESMGHTFVNAWRVYEDFLNIFVYSSLSSLRC